jgi:hypothetical protein
LQVGLFLQTLRIYWPERDILDGKWTQSLIKRVR